MIQTWIPAVQTPCMGEDPEHYFAKAHSATTENRRVKALCGECPVKRDCLDYATRHKVLGIWGGTTYEEREAIRKAEGIKGRLVEAGSFLPQYPAYKGQGFKAYRSTLIEWFKRHGIERGPLRLIDADNQPVFWESWEAYRDSDEYKESRRRSQNLEAMWAGQRKARQNGTAKRTANQAAWGKGNLV